MDYYDKILQCLNSIDSKVIDQWFTTKRFLTLITKSINSIPLPTEIKCKSTINDIFGDMHVGGKYLDEDDEDGYPSILLNWGFKEKCEIFGDKEQWELTK